MAGHRMRGAVVQALEARAKAELEEGGTLLDYVCGWLESGETLSSLTDELATELDLTISRNLLPNYLRAKYGEDGQARLAHARSIGATSMVEDARDIIDGADASSRENLQHAQMRANIRTWTAERFNREQFGQPKQGSVTINVGHLHLDALRQRASLATQPRAIVGSVEVTQGSASDIAAGIAPEPDFVIDSAVTT